MDRKWEIKQATPYLKVCSTEECGTKQIGNIATFINWWAEVKTHWKIIADTQVLKQTGQLDTVMWAKQTPVFSTSNKSLQLIILPEMENIQGSINWSVFQSFCLRYLSPGAEFINPSKSHESNSWKPVSLHDSAYRNIARSSKFMTYAPQRSWYFPWEKNGCILNFELLRLVFPNH